MIRGAARVAALALLLAASASATLQPVPAMPGQAAGHQAGVRVVEDHGIWWFEDGAGKRFFSLGACCVAGCWGHAEDRPMAPADRERVTGQLKRWGFNTAAAWSRPSVYADFYVAEQIYTGFNTSYRPKDKREDVFDDRFWSGWMPGQVRSEVAQLKTLPTLIGYFVDNEPHWNEHAVLAFYLGLAPTAPGSRALVAFSRSVYGGDLTALNRAWGTRLASFDRVAGSKPPKATTRGLGRFAAAWRTEVAGTYYARYIALVRAADPDHLILGVRWAGPPDLDLYRRITALCDVSSINDYNRYGTLGGRYAEFYDATARPIMITEWSFSGYPEPGHKSLQFIDVGTQARRAEGYRKYVLAAARAPYMIGMHWFLWGDYDHQDEAAGGYPPDENMGLVTNDGATVYEVLTAECTRTNSEVEAVHQAAARAVIVDRPPADLDLVTLTVSVDGDLAEWRAIPSVTPWISEALEPGERPGHRYRVAADSRWLYVAAEIPDDRIEDPGEDWAWEGDALTVYLNPEKRAGEDDDRGRSFIIYPCRGGADGTQASVGSWEGPVPAARAAMRRHPGGYAVEARLPRPAGMTADSGAWRISLNYRDVGGLYETWWDGRVTPR